MTESVEFPGWLNVSLETLDKFRALCDLVKHWNPAINLIAKSTVVDIWNRHLLDSAQLFDHCPADARTWLDIGSGAGFPGLVVAIMATETRQELCVTLVESDRRKSVFLSEAIRQLSLSANMICSRIDSVAPQGSDVVSARALSPLTVLCAHAHRHLAASGVAIFPKGAHAATEIAVAQQSWRFEVASHRSRTDDEAAILVLKDIRNV